MTNERVVLQAQRHIRALSVASECASLGARMRTIQLLTGLSSGQLQHIFRHPLSGPRRGRHPDSSEWYHTANLLCRTEASIVVSVFRRLSTAGIDPPQALIAGYRHYVLGCASEPRIGFDRAFDLIGHSTGRWLASKRSFSVFTCPSCHSEYLASLGLTPLTNHDCPFCKLVQRYPKDPRIQASYPSRQPVTDAQVIWVGGCWSHPLGAQQAANSS